MSEAVEAAIEALSKRGYQVEREDFPPPPFPGLYRVNDGPELTEAQLVQLAGGPHD